MGFTLADLIKLKQANQPGHYEGVAAQAQKEANAPAEMQRHLQALEQLKASNPNAEAFKAGDVSVSMGDKTDKLASLLLRKEQLNSLQEQRKNMATERLGKAYVAAKLPEQEQFAEEAARTLTPENIKGAYGGILGKAAELPIIGGAAARIQEYADPQAAKTKAVMEQLKSYPRHELFGATLTGQEKQAAELALGGGLQKNPEMVKYAVSALNKMIANKKKAVTSAFPQDVRESYLSEIGRPSMQQSTPGTPQSTGPHGPAVVQDGVTYKWNPSTQQYE